MACRIKNTGKHLLCLDLLGGEALYLKPGETSRALREELLYLNPYLPDLLKGGLAQRIEARMAEVIEAERRQGSEPEKAGEAKGKLKPEAAASPKQREKPPSKKGHTA